jgi:hypothetical protein
MFNPNIDTITELLLPVALRRPQTKAWLKALLKPLKQLLNTFQNYRLAAYQTLTHTGQVMYLEHLLNMIYFPTHTQNNRINITDSTDPRPDDYLHNTSEGQQSFYFYNKLEGETPEYLFNKTEFLFNNDFIVNVPNFISIVEAQVKHTIDRYRQAGKRYSINYFEINP